MPGTLTDNPPVSVEAWEKPAPAEFQLDNAPHIASEPIARCPVCDNGGFTPHSFGYDYELRTCRNTWRFVECNTCRHVWLNPRPAISTLATIYPPHYYAYNYTTQVNSLALKIKNGMDRKKFQGMLRVLGRPIRSFVDIGCGDGRYLRFAEEAGVPKNRDYGLELDPAAVKRLNDQGWVGLCQRVEDCTDIAPGSIDLATMFHVIEHVDDPKAVARQAAKWIAPGGLFVIETPNIDSFDARLFKKTYWGGYHIPRHWNLFTPASLRRLLEDAGLEVVGTQYQTGHSFWLYSMHHVTRYAGGSRPRLAKLFDPMGGFLPILAGVTAFDKLRGKLGAKTSSMLMLARKPG
jgi:SAM-dependent methyltransferase